MIEIKNEDKEVIALVLNRADIQGGSRWLSNDKDGLQIAVMKYNEGKEFEAHKHIMRPRLSNYTEEAILVFQGRLKVGIFDLGKNELYSGILESGDMVVTRRGYHQYMVMTENTIFFEFKNGPFTTRSEDKQFLFQ